MLKKYHIGKRQVPLRCISSLLFVQAGFVASAGLLYLCKTMLYVLLAIALLAPALLMRAEHRLKLIAWMSPAFWAYALGLALGNLFHLSPAGREVCESAVGGLVIVAIPLVMFSSHVRSWAHLAPKTLLSFGLNVAATMVASSVAWYLFRDRLPDARAIAAMTATVYTGNSANLAAVGQIAGAPKELILQVTLSDMINSGLYLLLVFSFAKPLLLKFLPAFSGSTEEIAGFHDEKRDMPGWQAVVLGLVFAAVCAGLGVAISKWLTGEMNSAIIIVSVTVLGVLASLLKGVRTLPHTYNAGQYLLLSFCIIIGLMADINTIINGSIEVLIFVFIALYGTVVLHLLAARLFRIDADTAIITSVAGICSPPFIGQVANTLHNRSMVMSGMTSGVIGIAISNLIGLAMLWLLG